MRGDGGALAGSGPDLQPAAERGQGPGCAKQGLPAGNRYPSATWLSTRRAGRNRSATSPTTASRAVATGADRGRPGTSGHRGAQGVRWQARQPHRVKLAEPPGPCPAACPHPVTAAGYPGEGGEQFRQEQPPGWLTEEVPQCGRIEQRHPLAQPGALRERSPWTPAQRRPAAQTPRTPGKGTLAPLVRRRRHPGRARHAIRQDAPAAAAAWPGRCAVTRHPPPGRWRRSSGWRPRAKRLPRPAERGRHR
jgi:hypothetical protein